SSYGSFNGTALTASPNTISVTFANGVATANLKLNKAAAQTISLSVSDVATPAANTLSITPSAGSAASMALTTDVTAPAGNGGVFAQQPVVTLRDAYGNTSVSDSTTVVTVSKKDTGTWTLTGTATATASSGVATFTGLVATNAAGVTGAQLAFDTGGLPQITSADVTLPWSGAAAPRVESVAGGDGHVLLNWSEVSGSVSYAVYQSTASGTYGAAVATVSGSVYDLKGLMNGTTYYFVVKAVNPAGISAASNEVSATPQVPLPGAAILQPALAGNAQVSLTWNPVIGSTGYKIFKSTASGTYGATVATVSGSVYDYKATGLINGTTYYFVVQATNPGGDSAASNEVSATPVTVPAAPMDVTAAAGNGQAIVSFTIPAVNGGGAITGYEVTASPGNITATGAASPITVTGLSNGTTYTFTVKAINSAGNGAASAASNEVTPRARSNSNSNSGGSDTSTQLATPSTEDTGGTVVQILVNGKAENAGTATTTTVNNQAVTTIWIDSKKMEDMLALANQHTVITIPVNTNTDVVVVELNGQIVKSMEQKQAVVEIKTENATYTLPAQHINISAVWDQLGKNMQLEDIKIQIEISKPTIDMVKIVENSAVKGEFTIVAPPLNFTVKANYGDTTIEVSKFNAYVERTIAIPDGVDPSKVTTGVIVDPDGTVRHVPTKIVIIDGKYFAKVNSLTNSTYSIVSNPVAFKDVAQHWAKDAVNDMGSRMVLSGIGNEQFSPDREITRAEFAAIIVRGLGLKMENGTLPFSDVKTSDWYSSVINTAYGYHLISGFEDGTFHPNDNITREQAMVMIAKAMTITNLKAKLPVQSTDATLRPYTDTADASSWALSSMADSVQAGVISGRNSTGLAPKAYITRAEVAMIIQRLLQKSELI
ncbi:Fibronectin type III domain-containing protein, partial [Paenibacillus sp. 1_12]|uniref:S-layer homology domain-containing protein n=1 Tax=Paenibacillus sp. 1_12 TaxID=1566278 RepID=UPI0008F446A2